MDDAMASTMEPSAVLCMDHAMGDAMASSMDGSVDDAMGSPMAISMALRPWHRPRMTPWAMS